MSFPTAMPAYTSQSIESRLRLFHSGRFVLVSAVLSGLIFSSIVYAESKDVSAKLTELGYEPGEAVDRVDNYRVNGWNYIDNRHIVIYAGPAKRFLITTLNDCQDLSSTEHIGFTSTVNSLTKFDKLIVRSASGIMQNCPITEIRTLSKTEAKR